MSRGMKGSAHPNAKLTETEVRTIRWLRRSGRTFRYLADILDMSVGQISDICNRKAWRHVQ